MSLKSIRIETVPARIGIIGAMLLSLAGGYIFAKWCFANAAVVRAEYKEIADLAVDLAPSDPQTHFTSAILLEKTFLPGDLEKSVAEYERATSLAPNNYVLWLALGRARERSGDAEGGEKAVRRAAELAPNYAQVRWTLGNILLRQGKIDEAFAEIRQAAQADPNFINPAISSAWQFFDGDTRRIKQIVGDSAAVNASLASFLAGQKRFDEAIEVWNSLSAESKQTDFKQIGEQLSQQLLAEKKYRAARQLSAPIVDSAPKTDIEQIANGNFETDVRTEKAGIFEWQFGGGNHPQIGLDNQQKRGGERSLLLIFNSDNGKEFRQISQTVIVEPGKKYQLSFFYKSDLKTPTTVRWEILNTPDGKILATAPAIGTQADWTAASVSFNAVAEAVTIRLVRDNCKSPICPISGKVWFDDFSLSKTN